MGPRCLGSTTISSGSGSSPRSRASSCAGVGCFLVHLDRLAVHREGLVAAAHRLGHAYDEPGERERREREHHEGGAPRQRRDVAGDREPDPRADELPGQDEAVDPSALGTVKVVADEGCDEWSSACRHGAECHPRHEQLADRRDRGTPDHCSAPEDDCGAQRPRTVDAIRQYAEGQARQGAVR
jgi:hypothetical protein